MRCIDADALEKEGWSLHRTIQVDKYTSDYQTKPLRQVPTIEPEPHWIPCSERLPEADGKYLVSVNLDGHEYCDEDYWHRDSWNMYFKKSITAWMPKIEPYLEGE